MEIHILPERESWNRLLQRDAVASTHEETARIVSGIFDDVAANGDRAVREYEKKFTGAVRESLRVAEDEIEDRKSVV